VPIIENRPGAGGLIGIELSGRAPNDGYTLLTVASNITILPVTNKNAKYNLLGDFAPISQRFLTVYLTVFGFRFHQLSSCFRCLWLQEMMEWE
jgi:tripartite-type tricarboxylate transporter receptor subunit TctC